MVLGKHITWYTKGSAKKKQKNMYNNLHDYILIFEFKNNSGDLLPQLKCIDAS